MRHPDYPIWSLICLVLVLSPSPWHWRARNISTIGLIFWSAVYNCIVFINTLVWADNYADVAPVWSEISCRLIAVVPYAVPLCSLSQMRRLASVASPKRPLFSPKARRRRLIEEGIMCFFSPLLMLPLLYIVQGHRYDISEGLGPSMADMNTWPSSVLRYSTTVLIALGSFVYAGSAVYWFFKSRSQFRSILSGSGLTTGRYFRLAALAMSDSVISLFLTLFNFLVRIVVYHTGWTPYVSWAWVHDNFDLISQYPEEARPNDNFAILQIAVPFYTVCIYAIVFFAFFGFGEEAIAEYLKLWASLRNWGNPSGATKIESFRKPSLNLGSTVMTLSGSQVPDIERSGPMSTTRLAPADSSPQHIAMRIEQSVA